MKSMLSRLPSGIDSLQADPKQAVCLCFGPNLIQYIAGHCRTNSKEIEIDVEVLLPIGVFRSEAEVYLCTRACQHGILGRAVLQSHCGEHWVVLMLQTSTLPLILLPSLRYILLSEVLGSRGLLIQDRGSWLSCSARRICSAHTCLSRGYQNPLLYILCSLVPDCVPGSHQTDLQYSMWRCWIPMQSSWPWFSRFCCSAVKTP